MEKGEPETFVSQTIDELVLRAGTTMFGEARLPTDRREWQELMNWIGLNVESYPFETAERIWLFYGVPMGVGELHAIIRYQRGERQKLGLPCKEDEK